MRGDQEEGTTATRSDMVKTKDLDRLHLVMDVIDRVPAVQGRVAHLRQRMVDARVTVRAYTREDDPKISSWTRPY